jgi:membrane protease YdiL (CAAX protease family)
MNRDIQACPERGRRDAQDEEEDVRYPTLRQVAVLIASLLLSLLVQAAIYPAFPRLSVAASGATTIALAWALIRRWGMSPRRVLLLNGIGARAVVHVLFLTAVFAVLLAEVQALTAPFLPMPDRFTEFLGKMEGLLTVRDGWDLLWAVVAISLFPAVSEEMVFRGLTLTGLRRRFGASAAVVGSGALFALIHLNPWQFVPLLLIGVFISFIVHRTDSLYAGIVAHGTNNLLSLAALNVGRRYHLAALDPQAHLPPEVVLPALALFIVGMTSFLITTQKRDEPTGRGTDGA